MVIFKLPELSTSWAARSWWSTFLARLDARMPRPPSVRILDFYDHITATFADIDDAAQFHEGTREAEMPFKMLDGTEGTVEAFRPRPPHIKRRGTALDPIYDVISAKELKAGEVIKQVHRARGPQPYMLDYTMERATENIRWLATVCWNDTGVRVNLKEVVTEPGVDGETQAALQSLVGRPAP